MTTNPNILQRFRPKVFSTIWTVWTCTTSYGMWIQYTKHCLSVRRHGQRAIIFSRKHVYVWRKFYVPKWRNVSSTRVLLRKKIEVINPIRKRKKWTENLTAPMQVHNSQRTFSAWSKYFATYWRFTNIRYNEVFYEVWTYSDTFKRNCFCGYRL